jgi:UPF0716 protein FxsA
MLYGRKILFAKLFLIFILVPALELILLIQIGQVIGVWATIALILLTGSVGAFLVRSQGLQVWNRLRGDLKGGQLPSDAIFDGVLVLLAGAFLLTPGILTDIVGFLCVLPFTRPTIRRLVWAGVKRGMQGNIFTMTSPTQPVYRHHEPEDVIVIKPDEPQRQDERPNRLN